MEHNETGIAVSWTKTALYLIVTGAISAFGFLVILNSEDYVGPRIIGFALFMALPLCFVLLLRKGTAGEGPCPICGSRIQTDLGSESCILCKNCGRYLEAANKKLKPMDENRVESSPTFAVPTPWSDLIGVSYPTAPMSIDDYLFDKLMSKHEGVRVLDAHWPAGCCVCGKPATREMVIGRVINYSAPKRIRMRDKQVTLIAQGIPYCDQHSGGVDFSAVRFGTPPRTEYGFGLRFCSYAYRDKFWKKNLWKWA